MFMHNFIKIISVITLLVLLKVSFALADDVVYFYNTDPAGTPLVMSDSTGSVVWRADYLPFGEETIDLSTVQNYMMFVGKEQDSESGLYYFGARFQDPAAGRFISPDVIGPVDAATGLVNKTILHNPQLLNIYAYSLNNPYKYFDPDGRIIKIIGTEAEKKIIQSDLNKLKNRSATGKIVIEKLEDSKETINIETTKDGNSYNPSDKTIEYNPNIDHIYSGKEKWNYRDPEVGLGHEAIHGMHDIENNLGTTREIEESQTVGIGDYAKAPLTENRIRSDYGFERRPQY